MKDNRDKEINHLGTSSRAGREGGRLCCEKRGSEANELSSAVYFSTCCSLSEGSLRIHLKCLSSVQEPASVSLML